MLQRWYKNAVLYCLDVETFQDSNDDGIGDFRGLASRLDYLSGLGVTCLWLMPFYPTPNRDNGYDVIEYFAVDPRLGNLGDFIDFMHAADDRGIRVIIDLVVNHTSIDHPWFREARSSPDSPYRDYYVWKETKPADADENIVFPGYQTTTWTYDEQAEAYYFHRFYKHQAELNIGNPAVRDEIRKVMAFWLKLGVSGFRVDAAPKLIELTAIEGADVEEPYEYLVEFRDYLTWYRGDAVLLAEANVGMEEVPKYFGKGEKLQMMFNFVLNQHVMLALARGEATPIREGLYRPPEIPNQCQWANFLRNHDELAVNQLSDRQQQELFDAFGPDEEMQIYDRGIRRRLPPMLGGNLNQLKLTHSLLFTLPGTPVIRYGEEIGMGEDLSLDQRDSIRTPMQWSDEEGGGFSRVARDQEIRPTLDEGPFGYKSVNVAEQQRDAKSLLNATKHMIRVRKENLAFGWGQWQLLETDNPYVLVHRCDWQHTTVLAVHNLSAEPQTIEMDMADLKNEAIEELLSDRDYESPRKAADPLEIGEYGYRWFRLRSTITDHPRTM